MPGNRKRKPIPALITLFDSLSTFESECPFCNEKWAAQTLWKKGEWIFTYTQVVQGNMLLIHYLVGGFFFCDLEIQHGDPDHPKKLINCFLYHCRAIVKMSSKSTHNFAVVWVGIFFFLCVFKAKYHMMQYMITKTCQKRLKSNESLITLL